MKNKQTNKPTNQKAIGGGGGGRGHELKDLKLVKERVLFYHTENRGMKFHGKMLALYVKCLISQVLLCHRE